MIETVRADQERGAVFDAAPPAAIATRAIVAHGTTVVLTTQYLDEADRLADRIAVVDHGRVIAEGTRGELKASVGAGGVRVRIADAAQRARAQSLLSAELGVPVHVDRDPAALTATLPAADGKAAERVAAALAELTRAGVGVSGFALGEPSLDEVFLALTGSRGGSGTPDAGVAA